MRCYLVCHRLPPDPQSTRQPYILAKLGNMCYLLILGRVGRVGRFVELGLEGCRQVGSLSSASKEHIALHIALARRAPEGSADYYYYSY